MAKWRGATTIGIGRNLCGLCDKPKPTISGDAPPVTTFVSLFEWVRGESF